VNLAIGERRKKKETFLKHPAFAGFLSSRGGVGSVESKK
jgi:hypothetical protein